MPSSFPNELPRDPKELERSLNEGLRQYFGVETNPVRVAFPAEKQVEIAARIADLETAVTQLTKGEAARHGVNVEEVRLNFRELGPRALSAEANVRARKMFFTTTIRVTGQLQIDEQLTATISNLNCSGEGAIGSIACGFLGPHLAKLNGQAFPLAAFLSGELSLRDVRITVGDNLAVTAEFAA